MSLSPLAGQPAPRQLFTNIPLLVSKYYTEHPDAANLAQQISFGTSGHRGTSTDGSFNEDHILAVCQALCEYRQQQGITGPLFIGKDTHALSEPAEATAIEVFAANGLEIFIPSGQIYTPTPVVSHAILTWNKGRKNNLADGIVITPSHNPPADGGFKYNPPNGGPAGPEITNSIQSRANEILRSGLKLVKRIPLSQAMRASTTHLHDFANPYIHDLKNVIDIEKIASSGIRIGVDPMGGAAVGYWDIIADFYKLNITVVNEAVDPAFTFMSVDHDGKIRMDCSSPYAMAGLIRIKDDYDIAFGNDPDTDRHGIVTPTAGLMNPNHYLAVAISYLFQNRSEWSRHARIGKTLVSSSMIDRVARSLNRELAEVPVGFKWFVDGLVDGSFGFGGEESAGASFLRKDGTVWTTDKDGILLNLLAAEITAVTGRDPGQHYNDLVHQFGSPVYKRIDATANSAQKNVLKNLSPDDVNAQTLAGEKIIARLTKAPFNGASIGGLKVVTENGWFAARPSGTEEIYKIYAESFIDNAHLLRVIDEAQNIVSAAFKAAGA
ncbi:MAG: phosphoglucomutase (alpha-D-glucose-1,6-bisphosphate-dependent) [Chloroflexi bacterium]|nr:phosphoglucomutase (alpha-D-glucose-1,6-bisphosphate-dependent) [Chloroflexota bacterium]